MINPETAGKLTEDQFEMGESELLRYFTTTIEQSEELDSSVSLNLSLGNSYTSILCFIPLCNSALNSA